MDVKSYLNVTDVNLLKIIEKNLGEDPERLERQVFLFKEWLNNEPHLPKDIDDNFVNNFVRFCKCNLDKAQRKFESFLAARVNWRLSHPDLILDQKYFTLYNVHREYVVHPKLTPDGYRVLFYRLPTIDRFDFEHALRYGILINDIFLFESTSSGAIIVCDYKNSTPQFLPKVNIKALGAWLSTTLNTSPLRFKNAHILNLPKVAEAMFNLALKLMSEKISKRVVVYKDIAEISKCLPDDIIPNQYGGSGGDLDQYGDQMREYLMNNEDFLKKTKALKLWGPIPTEKTNIYSFEDYVMEGSFRKLNID